jgi:hypothetical protein
VLTFSHLFPVHPWLVPRHSIHAFRNSKSRRFRLSTACQNSKHTPNSWFEWVFTGHGHRGPFGGGGGSWTGSGFWTMGGAKLSG